MTTLPKLILVGGKGQRRDNLGELMVESSGGVPGAWKALWSHLPRYGHVLDYGS